MILGSFPRLDPEVRDLLRRLVADPRSTLSRAPRTHCAEVLGLSGAATRLGDNFLSTIRCELIERSREEVGRLLMEAATAQLCLPNMVDSKLFIAAPRGVVEWTERTRRLRALYALPGLEQPLAMLAGAATHGESATPVSELVRASLELIACDESRVVLALALRSEGRAREARDVLQSVLSCSPRAKVLSLCHANLALLAADDRNFERALLEYRESCLVGDASDWMACCWLVFAMRAGRAGEVRDASARLMQMNAGQGDAIDRCVANLRHDVSQRQWFPTEECLRLLPTFAWRLPESARRFAHVVL